MKDIRLKLALEESQIIHTNTNESHEISPSAFLNVGIDLEEQQ